MKIIYDNIKNYTEKDYKFFFSLIKQSKQEKILHILKDEDKKRSILGEILLIRLLNKVNIDYNSITINKNKYGKPYIKDKKLFFNISHSKDYVVCVISNNEIGIDIEQVKQIKDSVINQFASNKEMQYIKQHEIYCNKRSFEIFTLKEAYFKCLGTNLNYIKQIEFVINNKKIISNKDNFNFKLIYDIENYIIAICENIN